MSKKKQDKNPFPPVIDNFLKLFKNKKEAIEYINDRCDYNFETSSFYIWKREDRANPSGVVLYIMIEKILTETGNEDIFELIRLN